MRSTNCTRAYSTRIRRPTSYTRLASMGLLLAVAACQDEPMAPASADNTPTYSGVHAPTSSDLPKIAFSALIDNTPHIFTVNPDGSGLQRLTKRAGGFAAAWSPDQQSIAFVRLSRQGLSEIYTMTASGRRARQITSFANISFTLDDPSWSPDGSTIVFSLSGGDQRGEIYLVAADGSAAPVRLTNDELYNLHPVFSPDGTKIALTRSDLGTFSDIYIMDANGQNIMQFTNCVVACSYPSWSPDGSKIAYKYGETLYVQALAGGSPVGIAAGLSSGARPRWSPDGTELVYAASDGTTDLFVVSAGGGEPRRITNSPLVERQPSWAQ